MSTQRPLHAAVALIAIALGIGWTSHAPAHEGHQHAPPPPVAGDPALVVRSAANDLYEVVVKYRSRAGQDSVQARVYVSDYATNAPVERLQVAVRTTAPHEVAAAARPVSPGVYEATLPLRAPERYVMDVTIGGAEAADFTFMDLPMGEDMGGASPAAAAGARIPWWAFAAAALVAVLAATAVVLSRRGRRRARTAVLILASAAAMASGARALAQAPVRDAATEATAASEARYLPKESQFLLGVRTVIARLESLRATVQAVGHVVPESGALATVQSPQAGRIEGRRLAVGDRVREGQVLAHLVVIDRLPVRAPISGVVAEVRFAPGQWVQAGEPLLVVIDERRVRVEMPLFGEDLERALRARSAVVTTRALPGRRFAATVRGLAPTAPEPRADDPTSATGPPVPPLILSVANPGGLLRPGMLVEASLELPASAERIAVPEGAVLQQEAGPVVFVHTDAERFEQRTVRIVGRYGARVGLAGAVAAGDRVVVEGTGSVAAAAIAPAAPAEEAPH